MAGRSCPAASSASPTSSMRAPSTCSRAGAPADAWILSDKPVAQTTLLPTPDRIKINRTTGALPSRAADNLFWLGRYVERTEATLRLVRALVNRATESTQTERDVNADIVGAARRLGGGAGGHAERPAGAGRGRRAAAAESDRRAAVPRRRRAVGGVGDPRPVLAGRLAGAHRAGRDDPRAVRAGAERKRDGRARQRRAAHPRVVLRPGAGEHEPARRLALPGDRPPHRADAGDLPPSSASSHSAPSPTAASTCCWNSPTARSPIGCAM